MAQLNLHHGKGLAITIGADAEVREFPARATITAGQWVALDTGQTHEERVDSVIVGAATGATIGVALEAATSGNTVRVCVAGYVEGARTNDSVANAGDTLVGIAGGLVGKGAPTNVKTAVGIALEVDAGSDPYTADVYVFRRF